MLEVIFLILLLSLLTESITYALRRAEPIQPLIRVLTSRIEFLDSLFSCGYCLSFWVSLLVVSSYLLLETEPVILFKTMFLPTALNLGVMLLIVHRFSNIIHGSIDKYFDRHYDKRYRSFFDDLE